ncbi:MAG: fibronectin type III domain-containing protein [Nitrosopumilus sp.]|uniref:fibronectin type III domain-containing protein n=1 Tax=Nitrosopumilus sp. TaxID=2024843 RepID=UPI00242DBA24|nr:fibronectin type III domain-containing protein [Nitrosopumilus sp.]MCV0367244.1 fibronectin type III domain-containing protein [Nitrosopumilus sp.]
MKILSMLLIVLLFSFIFEDIWALPIEPDKVKGLTATATSPSQIDLSWDEPYDGESPITGYQIERKKASDSWEIYIADTGNTDTAYSDQGLDVNTVYRYRVSAINEIGIGTASTAKAATTFAITEPDKVTGLSATAVSPIQIDLSWDKPYDGNSPIIGYQIERKKASDAWEIYIVDTGSTVTTYSDQGLDMNTTYRYKISAINAIGIGPASTAKAAKTLDITDPDKVTGLTATATSPSQIDLSWDEPYDGESPITGYQIERKKASDSWEIYIADTGNTDTAYSDQGLDVNTVYSYKISAINAIGMGSASSIASANTLNLVPTIPSSPLNLSGAFDGTNYTLAWDMPNSDGGSVITDYIIEYSRDALNWNTYYDNVGISTNSILTGLVGESYYFRVYAVNAIGTSLPSDLVKVISTAYGTGSDSRNPPKIAGMGIFKINETEQSDAIIPNRFENYFLYSKHSNVSDRELYGDKYSKTGTYWDKKDFDKIQPIFPKNHDIFQIQIPIIDEYYGSKIEHVSLYFQDKSNKPNSELWVSFDKPGNIQVNDPQKIFKNVDVFYSLEDDYFWAVFNIEFGKPFSSGILIESWHESKRPVYEFVSDVLESDSEFSENRSKIEHMATIDINSHTSSPKCKETHDCYIPNDAYVLEGGMVMWHNHDEDFIHTITSGMSETGPNNIFNGMLRPGEMFHNTFGTEGKYPYYCMIHPWAEGTVTVVKENILPPEKIIHSTETNIEGNVLIPATEKFPLIVKSLASGKTNIINTNDVVQIESKNLKVEIVGFVGTKNPANQIKVQIIRPDNSEKIYNTPITNDGHYSLLTTLSEQWQEGMYQVEVFYGKNRIGNITFDVIEKKDNGFGGILKYDVSASGLKSINGSEFYRETENLGWYSLKVGEKHTIFQLTEIENTDLDQKIPPKLTNEIPEHGLTLFVIVPVVILTSVIGIASIYRKK